jgi:glutathione S-transferase
MGLVRPYSCPASERRWHGAANRYSIADIHLFRLYWAAHIALHEIGAPFEAKPLSFARKETRSPDFLALNPEGKVPTLLVDSRPLTEVAAILFYLAKRFPAHRAGTWREVEGKHRRLRSTLDRCKLPAASPCGNPIRPDGARGRHAPRSTTAEPTLS